MFLIVKNIAGVSFKVDNKTLNLNGGGLINEVSKDDFELFKSKSKSFARFLEQGHIITSDSKAPKDEVKADIASEVAKKQDEDTPKDNKGRKAVKKV